MDERTLLPALLVQPWTSIDRLDRQGEYCWQSDWHVWQLSRVLTRYFKQLLLLLLSQHWHWQNVDAPILLRHVPVRDKGEQDEEYCVRHDWVQDGDEHAEDDMTPRLLDGQFELVGQHEHEQRLSNQGLTVVVVVGVDKHWATNPPVFAARHTGYCDRHSSRHDCNVQAWTVILGNGIGVHEKPLQQEHEQLVCWAWMVVRNNKRSMSDSN